MLYHNIIEFWLKEACKESGEAVLIGWASCHNDPQAKESRDKFLSRLIIRKTN